MEGKVRGLFYKMYPDSDPKYYGYFSFGQNVDGGKLTSIDVYYTHNLKYNDYVQIIKGKNDKDPRWEKYLYSFNFPKIWRLGGGVQSYKRHRQKLNYQLHNFRIHVSDKEYFMSNHPSARQGLKERHSMRRPFII